jgi:hypothetical protein
VCLQPSGELVDVMIDDFNRKAVRIEVNSNSDYGEAPTWSTPGCNQDQSELFKAQS